MRRLTTANESERLRILYQYEILDTVSEKAFDDLTALAAAICGTPIATISLIDQDRQWFKSAVGLSTRETARDVSFCAHAIAGSGLMQVKDATLDPRFAENPLVTGDPQIRFYAGSPLVSPEEQAVGTLCVIDRVPRTLTEEQKHALELLSRQVVSMLELRRGLLNVARLEAEQEETNARMRLLEAAIRQTRDTVLITEANLEQPGPKIVYVNPAFTEMTGYAAEEAIGATPRILQGPKTSRALLDSLRRQLRNGERFEGESINYRKDGGEYAIEWSVSPVRDDSGVIINYVGTQRDVTERRRLQEALAESRNALEERVEERTKELQEANTRLTAEIAERKRTAEELSETQGQLFQAQKMEVVGQLAGGIAHDFNNLLTAIIGYGTILLKELPPAERESSYLTEILAAAQRAAGLTKQLMSFSRHQAYETQVLDVAVLVAGVQKMLRQVIGDRIVLRTELDKAVSAIEVDGGQMEQVLLNLAINARDAMPAGGTITISARDVTLPPAQVQTTTSATEFVCLSIRDNGTGMTPEVCARIFEPFFTTKRAGKGTGLGLATCHSIVGKTGGWIRCETEIGQGTEFAIYLPAVAGLAPAVAETPGDESLPGGSETVLVVEDEPVVGELVKMLLSTLGYNVLRAEDGEEAAAIIAASKGAIDLVVTDWNMPRMDGRQLLELVRKGNPDLRVIVTSGDDLGDAATDVGLLTHTLMKPFTTHALAQKVRATLDSQMSASMG